MSSIHTIKPVYPSVSAEAPQAEDITLYDREHIITYARLLSAEQDGEHWRDAARVILRCDPEADPKGSKKCWETHLRRAHWIATEGVKIAVAHANKGLTDIQTKLADTRYD